MNKEQQVKTVSTLEKVVEESWQEYFDGKAVSHEEVMRKTEVGKQ